MYGDVQGLKWGSHALSCPHMLHPVKILSITICKQTAAQEGSLDYEGRVESCRSRISEWWNSQKSFRSPPSLWPPTLFFLLTWNQDLNTWTLLSIFLTMLSLIPGPFQEQPSFHPSHKPHQSPFSFVPSTSSMAQTLDVLEPAHHNVGNNLVYSCCLMGSDVTAVNTTEKLFTEGNTGRLEFWSDGWEPFQVLIILCCSLSKLKLNLNLLNPTISMWKVCRQCGR